MIAKQGVLDGLCSAYSVLNAVTLLWPEEMADDDVRRGLFKELVDYLTNHGVDSVTGSNDMVGLLDVTKAAVSRQFPGRLVVKRPWSSKRAGTIQEWLATLGERLAPGSVAILGLWTPEHWTVVRDVSENCVHFSDSASIPDELPVSALGMFRSKAEYVVAPKHCFILTRMEG